MSAKSGSNIVLLLLLYYSILLVALGALLLLQLWLCSVALPAPEVSQGSNTTMLLTIYLQR